MPEMTAKEFLQQYQDADHEINAKLDQICRLRDLLTKTTQTLTPDRVNSGGAEDKTSRVIAKIVDMEHDVDEDIDRLQEIKKQVEETIKQVSNPKQREVLTRRYINGQKWEEIAYKMNYCYMQVCRIHGDALCQIKNVIECYTRPVI